MQHRCWTSWKQEGIKRRLKLHQLLKHLEHLNKSLSEKESRKAQPCCRDLAQTTQLAAHRLKSHKQHAVHKLEESYNKRTSYLCLFHFQELHWEHLMLWRRPSWVLHCYAILMKTNPWGLRQMPLNSQLAEFWRNNLRLTANCTDYWLHTTARSC